MDSIQTQILRSLMRDAHISNARLAREVGLSESATLERVRRLEGEGVIQGYSVNVDPARVGRELEVWMTFILKNQNPQELRRFEKAMLEWDEVLSLGQVLGRFDFIAHVAIRDVDALQKFINEKLLKLGCIDRMESLTILKMVKRSHPPYPLD